MKLLTLFLLLWPCALLAYVPGTNVSSPGVLATPTEAGAISATQPSWTRSPLILNKATGALMVSTVGTSSTSIAGTVSISAVDLDIRNLSFATDKVDASGSSVSISNFPATQNVTGTVSISGQSLNFGSPASGLRVAAVLGNNTGEAAFGAGVVTPQTLRVVIADNPTQRTPARARATAPGTVTAGKQYVKIRNIGTTSATVLGVELEAGSEVEFFTNGNDTLSAIIYVASPTATLDISTVE